MSAIGTSCINDYPYASFYSDNYFDARSRFLCAVKKNPFHFDTHSIEIEAKGYNEEALFVDISWIGNPHANKFIIHMSGTHGVEGFTGSAIQTKLIETLLDIPSNVAIIFIHAINPYGMAHLCRVSENNCDLNRNASTSRISHPLYAKINDILNPKSSSAFASFVCDFNDLCRLYGQSSVYTSLIHGQYDFPEGLYYGGKKLEYAPEMILRWIEEKFTGVSEDSSVTIIDVHTGYNLDNTNLLIVSKPSPSQIKELEIKYKRPITAEWQFEGLLVDAIQNTILKVSQCALIRIEALMQELGTFSTFDPVRALYEENTKRHEAKVKSKTLAPHSPYRQRLFQTFCPLNPEWRHQTVVEGQKLFYIALNAL